MRRISWWSRPASTGSKSHSAAIWERNPDGSKKVIFPVAVRPAVIVSQNASRVEPPGATTPTPVTTLRLTCDPGSGCCGRRGLGRSMLGVDVPHRRPRCERAEMEDDERVLVADVPQAVLAVDRDEQAAAARARRSPRRRAPRRGCPRRRTRTPPRTGGSARRSSPPERSSRTPMKPVVHPTDFGLRSVRTSPPRLRVGRHIPHRPDGRAVLLCHVVLPRDWAKPAANAVTASSRESSGLDTPGLDLVRSPAWRGVE